MNAKTSRVGGARRNRPQTDAYMRACPSRTVIELLSDKWTLLVICALGGGPQRFGELRRRIDGVTQKMLTQTLRALERDGFLTRTVYPTTPPSVEYELTKLGLSSLELLEHLRLWAERHVWEVLAAREAFDRQAEARAVEPVGRRVAMARPGSRPSMRS